MPYICDDCPRRCHAERGVQGAGFCRMGEAPVLARAALHFDEEPVISGTRGAGTVFFSGCSLQCCFCQNEPISHGRFGKEITLQRLREIYFELIAQGAANIDLVNPTHYARAVLASLKEPLPVPVVWNSGGYDRVETLRWFEGKVQIWLPDLKYVSPKLSARYSGAPDYFEVASRALKEMYRQAGPVVIGEDGLMRSGLLVRHLILPGCVEDSKAVLRWIAEELPGAWVSLMAQYLPFGRALHIPELDRAITPEEYEQVYEELDRLGLEDGFVQELSSSDEKYIPSFDLSGV